MLLYMLLDAQVAPQRQCVCACVSGCLCAALRILQRSVQFFGRLLPPSVQNSCTDNPPVGAFVFAHQLRTTRDNVRVYVCAHMLLGVCVCARKFHPFFYSPPTARLRDGAASGLNPLSCVVRSCRISPIVSPYKAAQLKLNAS